MNTRAQIDTLRDQISERETELSILKARLVSLETQHQQNGRSDTNESRSSQTWPWPIAQEEYTRYGRQMILPEFGLSGQLRLRASKILIIGLGGLGCPAAAYLAGAGVGTLGLIDGDVVEVSNLHRQILHSSASVGLKKVDSAVMACRVYTTYPDHLDPITALQIFPSYDLILDCTDTPQTRYLISDAAVLCVKPLISASALRTDGQLIILNHPPTPPVQRRSSAISSGPCYRCIFPRPPPPESVTSCGEGGILGPVVGVMGVLMSLEAIKLLSSGSIDSVPASETVIPASSPQIEKPHSFSLTMLSASGFGPTTFRNIRLRGKRPECVACGESASITADDIISGSLNYSVFCGVADSISVLEKDERINTETLSKMLGSSTTAKLDEQLDTGPGSFTIAKHSSAAVKHNPPLSLPLILDVRDECQFSLCSLPGSINIPWSTLSAYNTKDDDPNALQELQSHLLSKPESSIYTICRLGNDSQLAVRKLQQLGIGRNPGQIKDVIGGYKSWKRDVDKDWPEY